MPLRLIFMFSFLILLRLGLHAQYNPLGSASVDGNDCYTLTPDVSGQVGAIWSANTIDLTQNFSISARLYFGDKDSDGADGIYFVFAPLPVLGNGGGSLGFEGISTSFGVEMDTYQNSDFGDPFDDHIALQINGDVYHTTANNLAGPVTFTSNIEDDQWYCFNFEWDATSQMISYSLNDNQFTYGPYDIVNSALAGNTNVHAGFMSATGLFSNLHQVCFSPPEIDPMEDVTICEGESTILSPDNRGESYLWQIDPTLDDITAQNPTATPTATTTYYVTIERECDYFVQDTVTVTVLPAPQATIASNSPICEGDTLFLMSSGGAAYQWSGPGSYSSTEQNPIITPVNTSNTGTYSVTVTDADGCTNTAMTDVVVHPLPELMISAPNPLCANTDPVLFMATPAGGTWTGDISPTGEVDPMALGAGTWVATYTYTDANGCENTEDHIFEIYPIPAVEIITEGPFCLSDGIQQLLAAPSGGQWGGAVSMNGDFDVNNLGMGVHEVWYIYTDLNGCTNADTALIQIVDNAVVMIDSIGPLCLDAGAQVLTATPGGGTWSGQIAPDGSFDPQDLGAGVHQFIYTSASMNCGGSDTIQIEVFDTPSANISGGGVYCEGIDTTFNIAIDVEGQSPFILVYTIDENDTTTLAITADTNLALSDAGQYSLISIVDGSGCSGAVSGMADISIISAPTVSNVVIMCDSTESFFTVSFDISGGDTLTYSVGSGASGTLTAGDPYRFESDNIPTGSNYLFVIDDANSCMPIEISGLHQCACITSAGTMPTDTMHLCAENQATTIGNGDHVLDGSDTLIYILHDGNSDMLGTIYATNDSAVFSFISTLVAGQVYYISAVAGNQSDTAAIDFSDPCFSVSPGTPVIWHAIPSGNITIDDTVLCQGDSTIIRFNFTGEAPFQFRYILDNDTSTATSAENFYEINLIGNTNNINITLLDISDNTPAACTALINQSIEVIVNLPSRSDAVARICSGDSVLLGGMIQTTAGVYFDTLSTINSCDSVVVTVLEVLDPDTTRLFDVTCDSSLLGSQHVQLNNVQGCDSIVITTYTFSLSDTVINYGSTCDRSTAGVSTRSLVGSDGCDSLVIDIIELLPTDTTRLEAITCDSSAVGVSQQIENNQFGCDSVIITTYALAPPMALNLTITHPHCLDSTAGAIAVAVQGGTGPFTYSLDTVAAQNQGIFTRLTSGNYRITVMDANGCQIQEEVILNSPTQFSVDLGENQVIDIGNSTELQATITINIDDVDSIRWTPTDTVCPRCLTIAVSPVETTTYGIVVTDENGCMANDDITIFVETNRKVFFPNAFSPNNDGVNDRFFPRSKDNVINNIRTLKIFNRWGGEVFEAFNLQPNRASDGWDGTANNEPLNPAVFVYYAEIEFADGTVEQFDGNIMLIR